MRGLIRTLYGSGDTPVRLTLVVVLQQITVGILLLAVFQAYLVEDLGAGLAYPGYAITCFSIVKLALHTPAGLAADNLGRRRTLVAGLAVSVPPVALMPVVGHPGLFLALAGLYGVGVAMVWPAIYAVLADRFGPSSRGRALAFLNAGYLVGFGTGGLVGAFVTDYASARAALGAAVAVQCSALLLALGVSSTAREVTVERMHLRASLRAALPAFHDPRILSLSGLILLASLGTSLLGPVIRAYSVESLGTQFSTFSLYMLGPGAVAALAFIPAGQLADVFGRLRPLTGGLALCGAALVGMGASGGPLSAALNAAVALVGYAMIQPSWAAALMDRVPEASRATLLGAVTGLIALASSVGPSLGGAIGQGWGPAATFRAAGVLVLVSFLVSLALLLRAGEPAPAEA